jgi:hypothetical protein
VVDSTSGHFKDPVLQIIFLPDKVSLSCLPLIRTRVGHCPKTQIINVKAVFDCLDTHCFLVIVVKQEKFMGICLPFTFEHASILSIFGIPIFKVLNIHIGKVNNQQGQVIHTYGIPSNGNINNNINYQ